MTSISTATAFIMMTLTQLLAGASVDEQLQRLSLWTRQNAHYQVECDRTLFFQPSNLACLMTVRNFTFAFAEQKLPRPPEPITVEISEFEKWQPIDENRRQSRIRIPVSASSDQISRFVSAELSRPNYQARLVRLNDIADLTAQLENVSGKKVEVSENLDLSAAIEGLYKLILLGKENRGLFNNDAEVIHLSSDFNFPYEQSLKLKINLSSYASVSELRSFLDRLKDKMEANGFDATIPPVFFDRQKRIESGEHALAQRFHVGEIHCSPVGRLLQTDCLGALERLDHSFQTPSLTLPTIDVLIVMSPDEMPLLADYYFDSNERKSILLVKSDATLPALRDFYISHGWTVSSGG